MFPSIKQFMESIGAECNNWSYAWSYIKHSEKLIIFGLWDVLKQNEYGLIFSEYWERDEIGHKKKGYNQSLEHIRLISEEGFRLKTFDMVHGEVINTKTGVKSAKCISFSEILTEKTLFNDGPDWKCGPINSKTKMPAVLSEDDDDEKYLEGTTRTVTATTHERNPQARQKCLDKFGYKCAACKFDFETVYGAHGKSFIHVHHLTPLSKINKQYQVNPIKDLVPLCPNCHAMVHRGKHMLSIRELKKLLYR